VSEDGQAEGVGSTKPDLEGLRREVLALEPKWLDEMRQATLEGDLGQMIILIERIREQNGPLADVLTGLADNFEHDLLLDLTTRPSDTQS
jgi:hypothetical protein